MPAEWRGGLAQISGCDPRPIGEQRGDALVGLLFLAPGRLRVWVTDALEIVLLGRIEEVFLYVQHKRSGDTKVAGRRVQITEGDQGWAADGHRSVRTQLANEEKRKGEGGSKVRAS